MAEKEEKEKTSASRVKDEHKDHDHKSYGLSEDLESFRQELEAKFPNLRITSGRRNPTEKFSHHHRGDAIDIGKENADAYEYLMNEREGLALLNKYGLGIIDETDPEMMNKTGATGPHFHIGKDTEYSKIAQERESTFDEYYVYPGREDAKYKKDEEGKWMINLGDKTKNEFIPLKENYQERSKVLEASAEKVIITPEKKKSYYATHPDQVYDKGGSGGNWSQSEGVSEGVVEGGNGMDTEFNFYDMLEAAPPEIKVFLQDVKKEAEKKKVSDKKKEESDNRKKLEQIKAQKQKKRDDFLKSLAKMNTEGFQKEAAPSKGNQQMRFQKTDVDLQGYNKLPNLPSMFTIPEFEKGGKFIRSYGWDYKKENDNYLTRREGDQEWISPKGEALEAIKREVFKEPEPSYSENEAVAGKLNSTEVNQPKSREEIMDYQRKLVNAGYDLGNYGEKGDGVDGVLGSMTKEALKAYESDGGDMSVYAPKPKILKEGGKVKTDSKQLVLPTLSRGAFKEGCRKKGCSANVSIKMGGLLGEAAGGADKLWAKDAWFNKDYYKKSGGKIIYETDERNTSKMKKLPKDIYKNLQVGDYVQLNRDDTKSSTKYAKMKDGNLKNENIEHLGFIVGKDEDGTPLIWHGSESGQAYIQRVDGDIRLEDHGDAISSYQIASIVRNPALIGKEDQLNKLVKKDFWTVSKGIDEDNILMPKEGSSDTQKNMINTVNSSIENFKGLGYKQEDVVYIGQLLVGGIMKNESSKGESKLIGAKGVAATLLKDVTGIVEGEASRGIYQLKPKTNFINKDGSLNNRGGQLEELGINIEDLPKSNEYQTKAGMLILLDNYKSLKEDSNYDPETDLYKGKIPASYMLAKSWQAGKNWYKQDKYKDLIDNFDIDYSWSALEAAAESVDVSGEYKNITTDLDRVKEGESKQYAQSDEYRELLRKEEEKEKTQMEAEKYSSPRSVYYTEPTSTTYVNNSKNESFTPKKKKIIENETPSFNDLYQFYSGAMSDVYSNSKK